MNLASTSTLTSIPSPACRRRLSSAHVPLPWRATHGESHPPPTTQVESPRRRCALAVVPPPDAIFGSPPPPARQGSASPVSAMGLEAGAGWVVLPEWAKIHSGLAQRHNCLLSFFLSI
jgi:hypothetical protein